MAIEGVVRLCHRCGVRLARDHTEDDLCSPCLRSVRDYDPRTDPLLLCRLYQIFSRRPNETIDLVKAMGVSAEHRRLVRDAVRTLRRHGFVIITPTPRKPGYRYTGYVETRRIGPCSSEERLEA